MQRLACCEGQMKEFSSRLWSLHALACVLLDPWWWRWCTSLALISELPWSKAKDFPCVACRMVRVSVHPDFLASLSLPASSPLPVQRHCLKSGWFSKKNQQAGRILITLLPISYRHIIATSTFWLKIWPFRFRMCHEIFAPCSHTANEEPTQRDWDSSRCPLPVGTSCKPYLCVAPQWSLQWAVIGLTSFYCP